MEFLKAKIKQEFNLDCYMPANGETSTIATPPSVLASVSTNLLSLEAGRFDARPDEIALKRPRLLHGVLVMRDNSLKLMEAKEACDALGISPHTMKYTSTVSLNFPGSMEDSFQRVDEIITNELRQTDLSLERNKKDFQLTVGQSVTIAVQENEEENMIKEIILSWDHANDNLGSHLFKALQNLGKK